ncbi:phosphate starvation-inducible protein [Pseudomonas phage Astolliot]|nr:phosphate starvation-inducible protein [Pseudomonas phage Astolliot]
MGNSNGKQPRLTRKEKQTLEAEQRAAMQGLGAALQAVATTSKLDLTKSQRTLGNHIKTYDLTFVTGAAGSGKTTGVLAEYVSQYLSDKTKQIIVIRTPVEAGSDKVGFLPDDLSAKMEPHFVSARDVLNTLLGREKVTCDMNKRIFFKIPNYCLGSTWDNALVLIDEAQQIQPMIMKLLLERAGKNTKIVVAGDPTQLYVEDKTRNGLTHARAKFIVDGESKYPNVSSFDFPLEDSKTRSDLAYTVVHAYNS